MSYALQPPVVLQLKRDVHAAPHAMVSGGEERDGCRIAECGNMNHLPPGHDGAEWRDGKRVSGKEEREAKIMK